MHAGQARFIRKLAAMDRQQRAVDRQQAMQLSWCSVGGSGGDALSKIGIVLKEVVQLKHNANMHEDGVEVRPTSTAGSECRRGVAGGALDGRHQPLKVWCNG